MKKITAAFMALAMVVALAGCSGKKDEIEEQEVKVELGENMTISQSDSQDLLGKLASLKGYEIRFKYFSEASEADDAGGATIGQTRTAWWYLDDSGEGTAYYNNDGAYYIYSYNNGKWEYVSSASGSAFADAARDMQNATSAYLYLANSYSGSCVKDGECEIAGRKCDVFKYDLSAIGFSGCYKFSIDKEYGITMKMEVISSVEADKSASYEVLDFTVGVRTPDFPDPEAINSFDYESGTWPANIYTEQIPEPEYGKINMAGVSGYSFLCIVDDIASDAVMDYINLLQDSEWGFKGEFFNYEGYLTFNGKSSKRGYNVQITYWDGSMSISVDKAEN